VGGEIRRFGEINQGQSSAVVLSATGVEHRGVAFSAQQTRSIGQIIAGLLLIWEIYEPEEMVNRVEFI